MLQVPSRECKVTLDHRIFAVRKDGNCELQRGTESLLIALEEKFDKIKRPRICFLDTHDAAILRNRLVRRHRQDVDAVGHREITLKSPIEDRCLAAGIKVRPEKTSKGKSKLKEVVVAPFQRRFSHSVTLSNPTEHSPKNIATPAEFSPVLGRSAHDVGLCVASTSLMVVGGVVPHERAHKGLTFELTQAVRASVAVILWTHSWKGRVICAERFFRFDSNEEANPVAAVDSALQLFSAIRQFDWSVPSSLTTTQLAYGGRG